MWDFKFFRSSHFYRWVISLYLLAYLSVDLLFFKNNINNLNLGILLILLIFGIADKFNFIKIPGLIELKKEFREKARTLESKLDRIIFQQSQKQVQSQTVINNTQPLQAEEVAETESTPLINSEPITVTPNFDSAVSAISIFGKKLHRCSHCGFNFYVDTNPAYAISVIGSTVTCPKCNNIDSIY